MVAGEVVALHRAGEALADRGAGDIDDLADLEVVALISVPTFRSSPSLRRGGTRPARARGDIGLGVVAGDGLADQLRALVAVSHLDGLVAVGLGVLTWVTRFGRTSITVTGMDSPASVKMRVMPRLRPTRDEDRETLHLGGQGHRPLDRCASAPRGFHDFRAELSIRR
jgi:hypothetical protein